MLCGAYYAQWHENNNSNMRRFMASYRSFSHYFLPSMISPSQLHLCIPFPRLLPHCAVCAPLLCFDILYAVWHANCVCCWDDCLRLLSPVPLSLCLCLSGFVFSSGFSLCLCPFSASSCGALRVSSSMHKYTSWQKAEAEAEKGRKGTERQAKTSVECALPKGVKTMTTKTKLATSSVTAKRQARGQRERERRGHRGSFC